MRSGALQSDPCPSLRASPGEILPSRVRHKVVALAFLLGFVLYLDRAAISVLAPAIRRDLHIGPLAMGGVFTAFVWGYALLNIPAGWLGDRFGARRVLTAIVLLWSFFTALSAAAWSLLSLLLFRFFFGAAESGATPNISKSFSRWIPVAERARAQGFYFSGTSAGMALAPPLVTLGLWQLGWRTTLVSLAGFGVAWAVVWYLWYRDRPRDHPAVNSAELLLIEDVATANHAHSIDWRRIFQSPNLWAILLMYFSYGYTGYIYISWFPSYLMEARHMSPALAGTLAGLPGLLGVFAKPLGGWLSDRLTQRYGVVFGRRSVGMLGFGIASAAVLPGLYVQNGYLAVALLAIGDGGAALAHGVCFAVCIDTGLKRAGTIAGLMLTFGSLGNAASALAFGYFLQFTGSWVAPFLIGMAANLVGTLLWLKVNPEEQFA
jgi:MFS family permease